MTKTKKTPGPKATASLGEKLAAKQVRTSKKRLADGVTKPKGKDADVKVVRRHKPGVVALSEIRKQAKLTDSCIERAPFIRLVKEVCQPAFKKGVDVRVSSDAIDNLMPFIEQVVVESLSESDKLRNHRGKKQLTVSDMAAREDIVGHPLVAATIRQRLCDSHTVVLRCEERTAKRNAKKDEEEEEQEQ